MTETIHRITEVLKHTKQSYHSLSKEIGLKRSQNLYDIRDGKVESISVGLASLIVDRFPEIDKEWLLTGNGQMLKPKSNSELDSPPQGKIYETFPPKHPVLEATPLRLADPFGYEATSEKIYQLPDESLIMQVPVIPYKAWASYLRGHADPEFYEGLETMPVPIERIHRGTYLIFETGGESMLNPGSRKSIWPEEKIIGRYLKRENWKYKLHLSKVNAWIIVHKEHGIVVKEIVAHDIDNGKITLHSWNPDKNEYPDYEVSLDDCEQIFNVVDPFNRFG